MEQLKKIRLDDVRLIIMDHDHKMALGNANTLFDSNEIGELIQYLQNTKNYVEQNHIDVEKFNNKIWKQQMQVD